MVWVGPAKLPTEAQNTPLLRRSRRKMANPSSAEAESESSDRAPSRNHGESCSDAEVSAFRNRADKLISKADDLENKVNDVLLSNAAKKPAKGSSRDRSRDIGNPSSSGKRLADGAPSRRMQELMRQFGTILKQSQFSQHKWIWPFMEPVDVKGLGLHDYYQIIKKPMDIGTIRNRMEDKDGTCYKHVREIYQDTRLVFTNAMTYNVDEKHDIHVMARSLLDKLEEKWLQLLPKVIEEETRQKEEEARAMADIKVAQESAIARVARDTNNELNELDMQLETLKDLVIQKCRKFTVHEKRKLGAEISSLSPEDLDKALEIIAEGNPSFQASTNAAEIDMDAQSEKTLWKLKFFVQRALEVRSRNNTNKVEENMRRKKEICDALTKTAKRRHKR